MRFCCRWGGIRRRSRFSGSRSLAGFREHGRSCRNLRLRRPACAPNADLGVQHGLGHCAHCRRHIPRHPSVAPDITSSIAPAAQDKQHQSSARKVERRSAALGPDQIGALLRGKPDDGSALVRAAQIALAKLGYAVKSDGVEDGATRRALRHFERAHGLTPTTKISSELVKQLMAAARG